MHYLFTYLYEKATFMEKKMKEYKGDKKISPQKGEELCKITPKELLQKAFEIEAHKET